MRRRHGVSVQSFQHLGEMEDATKVDLLCRAGWVVFFYFKTGSGPVVTKPSASGTGNEKIFKSKITSVPEKDEVLLRSYDVASRTSAFKANESQKEPRKQLSRVSYIAQICE